MNSRGTAGRSKRENNIQAPHAPTGIPIKSSHPIVPLESLQWTEEAGTPWSFRGEHYLYYPVVVYLNYGICSDLSFMRTGNRI